MINNSLNLNNQRNRCKFVTFLAKERYTPKLNVETSIYDIFYGLGRTKEFFINVKKHNHKISDNFRYLKKEGTQKIILKDYIILEKRMNSILNFLTHLPNSGTNFVDFKKINQLCIKGQQIIRKILNIIEEWETKEQQEQSQITTHSNNEFREEKDHLYQVLYGLESLREFSESNQAISSNKPFILLSGIAGSGKTHFLCDLSENRLKNNQPTFIFLGEEFNKENPWDVILKILDPKSTVEAFLNTLNSYAGNKRMRAVIIIDALNESFCKVNWTKLNIIKKYKNIGLILSVRNGFERECVPPSIDKHFIHIEHEGFIFKEWEAVTKFFGEYKLPLPEVPLLLPEFRIPLFLKIFCISYAKSKRPIKGHYGFAHIFEHYVINQGIDILKQLNESTGPQASISRIWNGVIKEIALRMGENSTERISESQITIIVKKIFPKKFKKALIYLEKFWLITKIPKYDKNFRQNGFDYRFPYQKFSDHLIVRNLLNKHLDKQDPIKSFRKNTALGNIIQKGWGARGLIESLSLQVPERLKGRELIYVTPKQFRTTDLAKDTFLQSLIWRDLNVKKNKAQSIKPKRVLNYINNYIATSYDENNKVLETLVAIAIIPGHPLNAHLLHKHLSKFKMPERDRFWIPFLNSYYGEQSSVDRLVAWGLNNLDKSKISKESVKLVAIPLIWFLSSSNRFLRDKSTKALVCLFEKHVNVLVNIISEFKNIDDLYIQERLYAIVYGCALKSQNEEEIVKLAIYTYKNVFKSKVPLEHLLLRDYARNIIELGLSYKKELKIDVKKIRPPYSSKWPSRIPSLSYLKKRYYSLKSGFVSRSNEFRDYGNIWYSLMYNNEGGIADFGNYIVNSALQNWSNIPIKRNFKTKKEIYDGFLSGLNKKQKYWWNRLEKIKQSISMTDLLIGIQEDKKDKPNTLKIIGNELDEKRQFASKIKNCFITTLNTKQKNIYKNFVTLYQQNKYEHDNLDYAAIQRLIFDEIIKLGWKPEYFAKFDSNVDEYMRSAHKCERIGKKYQWIAFNKVLAKIADNFSFYRGWTNESLGIYNGPWEIWKRDIDPSCLVDGTNADDDYHNCWWSPIKYNNWNPAKNNSDWVKMISDLPKHEKLIEVKDSMGEKWLVLKGNFCWTQPIPPGQERYNSPSRQINYSIWSYLVKKQNINDSFKWTKQQYFKESGDYFAESKEIYSIFLREFPFSISYIQAYGANHKMRWFKLKNKNEETNFKVLNTAECYSQGSGSYDCSINNSVSIYLPAKEIFEKMKLSFTEMDGKLKNENGTIIAMDPSVSEKGPSVLLVKKQEFLKFLQQEKLEVIWNIAGEKLMIGGDSWSAGRLKMRGMYKINSQDTLTGECCNKFILPLK